MKIKKTLITSLNKLKGDKKIKKWENYIGAVEIHFNNGDIILCKSEDEIVEAINSLFIPILKIKKKVV